MLETTDLCAGYNMSADILHNLNISIHEGECVAIVGKNGAGKSSLLVTLVGIVAINGGNIKVCGLDMTKANLPEIRKRAGLVFQNPDDQLFMPTVYDDIAFGPRNYGSSEDIVKSTVLKISSQFEITKLLQRNAYRLSGGEKRLAALAAVLVMQPQLLLLDEPSSFLDPCARRRLIDLLRDLPQTKLIATHDLDLALDLCQRVIIINQGSIAADGNCQELLRDQALLNINGLELPLSLTNFQISNI